MVASISIGVATKSTERKKKIYPKFPNVLKVNKIGY